MATHGDGSDEGEQEEATQASNDGHPALGAGATRSGVQPLLLSRPTLSRGTTIGRYMVLELLGEGGMGSVYCAYDPQLSRKVALKLLKPDLGSPEAKLRILREAQAMAQVNHPNVVAIYDVGTHDDEVFLAMELVDGQNLRQWLKVERPWREKLRTLIAAGRGLSAAHQRGLVHRDVKPDNVLVGADGRARVTDFGLARAEAEMEPSQSIPSAALQLKLKDVSVSSDITANGTVVGTAGYMPLEQLLARGVDAKSDQFSFAVTTWFALFGKRPYASTTLPEYLHDLEHRTPVAPEGTRVPAALTRALIKALSKDPSARFESLDALLDVLERDPTQRIKQWWPLAALALAAVFATTGAVVSRSRAANACDGTPNRLAPLWNPDVKTRLAGHLTSLGESGPDVFAAVASNLDTFTAEWVQVATEACRSTHVEGREPLDALQLKESCLDRQLVELSALVEVLANADAAVLPRAMQASAGLSRPRWCADARALKDNQGLPEDPARRAMVKTVQAELAGARALGRAGKHPESVARARAAVETARTSGWKPVEAEAMVALGVLQREADDPQASIETLEAAFTTSARAGARLLAAEAAIELSRELSSKFHRGQEADVWLTVARAQLPEALPVSVLAVRLEEARSVSFFAQKRFPEAVASDERALELARQVYEPEGVDMGSLQARSGTNLVLLGRMEEGHARLRQALAVLTRTLGATHYRVALLQNNLGASLLEQGQYAESKELLERALKTPFQLTQGGDMVSYLQVNLAQDELALGRPKEALVNASAALSAAEKFRDDPSFRTVYGWALLANDRPREALEHCTQAWRALEREGITAERHIPFENDSLTCMAEANVALAQVGAAVPLFEQSLGFPLKYPGGMARTRFGLARALAAQRSTDSVRLASLVAQALEELRPLSGRAPFDARRAEIERWRR